MFKVGEIVRYKDNRDQTINYYAIVISCELNKFREQVLDIIWLHSAKIVNNCPCGIFESMEE